MELLTQKQLREEYGIPFSRVHLWRLERDGHFPQRVKIGRRRIVYVRQQIEDWITSKLEHTHSS